MDRGGSPSRRDWLSWESLSQNSILRLILVVIAIWTVFGLLASFQMYANTTDERKAYPLFRVLQLGLGNSWLKCIVSLPLVFILQMLPFRPEAWKSRIATYAALLPLFVLVHVAIRPFVLPFVVYGGTMNATFSYLDKVAIGMRSFFLDDAWGFCCVLLGFHAYNYAEQVRFRALSESRLQTQLARAQLQLLKMQLQPHFLFNTLNTIYNLVPLNGGRAQKMITRLSELLRLSLEHVSIETISLQKELELLNGYLEIEKTRFEERLKVEYDVDPETLDAEVPNMILQPLVENSIRHGISKKAAGGTVIVKTYRDLSDRLVIAIVDDGTTPAAVAGSEGIGLSNARARLTQLYGSDFRFELTAHGDGAKVLIAIPYRVASCLGTGTLNYDAHTSADR